MKTLDATKGSGQPSARGSMPAPGVSSVAQRAEIRQIVHGLRLQPKLTVGEPHDPLEREADRVADRVMRMPDSEVVGGSGVEPPPAGSGGRIQRTCKDCEEDKIRRQSLELDDSVHAKEYPGEVPRLTDDVAARIRSVKGGGKPLPESVQSFFGLRFGADFSTVRVHDDANAWDLARRVEARAFTIGRDIVFGQQQYAPDNREGKKLLAHELTHTIQQSSAESSPPTLRRKPRATPSKGPLIPWAVEKQMADGLELQVRGWTIAIIQPANQVLRPVQHRADVPKGRYWLLVKTLTGGASVSFPKTGLKAMERMFPCWRGSFSVIEQGFESANDRKIASTSFGGDQRLCKRSLEPPAEEKASPDSPEPAPEPVDEKKIATLLDHLEKEKWNVDSLAAGLTDAEMKTLSLADRLALIRFIGDGFIVDDEDEQTIIRLMSTVSSIEDAKALVKELRAANSDLLQVLEGAIDGEEYTQYQQTLRKLFLAGLTPKAVLAKAAQAETFPWADPGVIQSMWKTRFFYEEITFTDEGKLKITYWKNDGVEGRVQVPRVVDPFELIKVRFHHAEPEMGVEEGQVVVMPAINLLSLYHKQFKRELWTALDVGLLFAGGAGVISAGSKAQKAIAALDLLLGVSDLAIREFRSDITKLDGGKEFLEIWDVVNLLIAVYGIARILVEVPTAFKRLKDAYKRFKASSASALDTDQARQLEGAMNGIFDGVTDAEQELKAAVVASPPAPKQLKAGPPPPKQLKAGPPPPKQLKAGPPPPKRLKAGPPPPKRLKAGPPPPKRLKAGPPPPKRLKAGPPPPKRLKAAPSAPEARSSTPRASKAKPLKQAEMIKARKTALKVKGTFKKAKSYHGLSDHLMSDEVVRDIMKNPEAIYLTHDKRKFIFHKGGNIAIANAGGSSSRGNLITAYGSAGIKGESGAKAVGGLPTDPGPPITTAMIVEGRIALPDGGFNPPAILIWP